MVLVMTVEPGFGGQKFMADQMEKLRALRAKRPELILEVDGGVNRETAPICRENGADVAVAGTAVFRAENIPPRSHCCAANDFLKYRVCTDSVRFVKSSHLFILANCFSHSRHRKPL